MLSSLFGKHCYAVLYYVLSYFTGVHFMMYRKYNVYVLVHQCIAACQTFTVEYCFLVY